MHDSVFRHPGDGPGGWRVRYYEAGLTDRGQRARPGAGPHRLDTPVTLPRVEFLWGLDFTAVIREGASVDEHSEFTITALWAPATPDNSPTCVE